MTVRQVRDKRGWAWRVAVAIVKSALWATTRPNWIDGRKIPEAGGCLLVPNHVSYADPLTIAHLVYDHGRLPHFLAKSELFANKVLGFLLRGLGQIPVDRFSRNAAGAYDAAVAGVRRGECLVVYPEGTITRDPDLWPMKGKSGAARIALETGCPVIPIGQWGAQDLMGPNEKRPHVFPRKTVAMKVGDPVDLSDLLAQQRSPAVVAEATARIMGAVTALVAELRGEQPPAEPFDARTTVAGEELP